MQKVPVPGPKKPSYPAIKNPISTAHPLCWRRSREVHDKLQFWPAILRPDGQL